MVKSVPGKLGWVKSCCFYVHCNVVAVRHYDTSYQLLCPVSASSDMSVLSYYYIMVVIFSPNALLGSVSRIR